MLKVMMAAAGAIVVTALPAGAQVVSTNEAAFDSIRNVTNYTFPFTGAAVPAPRYTQDGVTFVNAGQFEGNTGGEPTPFLAEIGPQTTVTFAGPVLGLRIASGTPLDYVFNGRPGSFTPGQFQHPTFIGFDTGSAAPVTVMFFGTGFDITGFQTALPEATTWAMMVLGLGVAGGALRRRRAVATGARFA